ncbi:SDR family NAD(P)-dependent oxidoreductase [Cellulomonas sp. ICMP 17802]|uniref:SDR family NAD(P)-dependent oxidoreductase n=1 Tax=Cellulomonas sp. ICMP 17802 TaxID=3239199 RepID=UPI00351B7D20
MDHHGTTALITGASSGLGVDFAHQLAARGADLVLVARRADRLEELASTLRAQHGVQVRVLPADLTLPGAAATLRAQLDGVHVDTLVNNAGFGHFGDLADTDPAVASGMVALNVAALVDLTRTFLPDLLAGRGALVNIASTAAYQPCPHLAVYGATKAFVLSFTEALHAETRGSGLRVLALSPGATRTEFFDIAGREAQVGRMQESADVVGLAMRALDRRRTPASIVSGRTNGLTAVASRLFPRRVTLAVSDRLMSPQSA